MSPICGHRAVPLVILQKIFVWMCRSESLGMGAADGMVRERVEHQAPRGFIREHPRRSAELFGLATEVTERGFWWVAPASMIIFLTTKHTNATNSNRLKHFCKDFQTCDFSNLLLRPLRNHLLTKVFPLFVSFVCFVVNPKNCSLILPPLSPL